MYCFYFFLFVFLSVIVHILLFYVLLRCNQKIIITMLPKPTQPSIRSRLVSKYQLRKATNCEMSFTAAKFLSPFVRLFVCQHQDYSKS